MPYSEQEQARIVKLYTMQDYGVVEIAKLLHHDSELVSQVLRAHGIWIRGTRNFTDSEEEQIGRIYLAGHSTRAIARAYRLKSKRSVIGALKRQGIQQRSPAERNRLYELDPHRFDVIDCEEKAYWLGFIYADGNVNRRTLRVSLKGSDQPHLEKLKFFMLSESPIHTGTARVQGKEYPQCSIEFTDRHLAGRLRELGILPRRPDFRPAVRAVSDPLLHHFTRGFFDGDGSMNTKPSLSFCGCEDFMLWLRSLLDARTDLNPLPKVSKHPKSRIFYLSIGKHHQAERVAHFMYDDANICLTRKRERFKSWPPPRKRPNRQKEPAH